MTLAFAPVFLLVGVGALLNVMTSRLGRVVDRARVVEVLLENDTEEVEITRHKEELQALGRRMRASNRAIYATSSSALSVCLVVPLLFFEQLAPITIDVIISLMFCTTMGFLTVGLAFFLREISVASSSLKIRQELLR